MKWAKRLALILGVVLILLLLAIGAGRQMLRGTPDWYQPRAISEVDREQAAQRLTNKLVDLQNRAAQARRDELVLQRDSSPPVEPPLLDVSFSEEEINAFFQKWAALHDWKAIYGRHLSDPMIVLQNHRIILAGKLSEHQTIISLHFQPSITPAGELELKLARVSGGRLPLPTGLIENHLVRLRRRIENALPQWKRDARIDPDGSANRPAIYATLGDLVIRVTQQQPAEPVLFLPLLDKGTMPVKVTSVNVSNRRIDLTVRPMSPGERIHLLDRLRNGQQTLSAIQ